jgi:type I restriction enzyme, S subunit
MNLSEIMTQVRGLSYSKKDSHNIYFEDSIPVLRAGNIQNARILQEDYVYVSNDLVKDKQYLKQGDVLIAASSGSISIVGKAAMVQSDMNATFGAFCKVLRPNAEKVNLNYFKHFFETAYYKRTIKSLAEGANINNLKTEHFDNLEIPLPPLDQQKKIAAILDAADAYRQKTKALIEKYDELTQSLFLDMFGDPITNPKGWEIKTLNDVCFKITDGTHHSPTPQESGYPYVTAKHVKPFSLQFDAKPSYVDEKAHNEIYKRCTPEYGDVLYIKDGATTGIACINTFKEPISMLSSLALLKLNDNINNQYLCHWLNHNGIKQKLISEFMSGAAIKRYTLKKIKLFKLMVPIIDLQNQFSERVQAIEAQKAQAQASLAQAEDLFNSLLQRAFKGELV